MNGYYVYIYLDPRKPGKYKYDEYKFDYEPFYVGKGKGRRFKDIDYNRSDYFKRKINKIKNSGLKLTFLKLKKNLNEEESFIQESKLIKLIGRKDLNKGTLVNFTDGGGGISGYIKTEEQLKKQRKDFCEIKNEFEHRGYRLLSNKKDYKNCDTKLEYVCPKGHIEKISWSHFQQEENCPKCYNEKLKEKYLGTNNPNNTLSESDVILIKMALREFKDIPQKELGQLFGVGRTQISRIKNNKRWTHIKLDKEPANE